MNYYKLKKIGGVVATIREADSMLVIGATKRGQGMRWKEKKNMRMAIGRDSKGMKISESID